MASWLMRARLDSGTAGREWAGVQDGLLSFPSVGMVSPTRLPLEDEMKITLGDDGLNKRITTAFACGPSTARCRCRCPESCEHIWDGPEISFDEGRGSSATCSRCGLDAIADDMWVGP